MAGYQVKGDVFIKVLELVGMKWGADGLQAVGNGSYLEEKWYPYENFCDLLNRVKSTLANGNPMIIYQLGFNVVKKDRRWQEIFGCLNPADVFVTTKRQEDLYHVGTYTSAAIGPKHVQVTLTGKDCRPEWCEFYRGRLQGVLELTGRTGVVHLQPAKEMDEARVFDIKWG
jgi:hypothetical protein